MKYSTKHVPPLKIEKARISLGLLRHTTDEKMTSKVEIMARFALAQMQYIARLSR